MSLIDSEKETFTRLTKTTSPDGYGGFKPAWVDGESIQAAVTLDTSTQARIAAVEGVTNLYTMTTSKEVQLHFHDVFRRESDGKVFRLTSDGTGKKTPATAGLNMRLATAEEWELPNE